jgi:uncharacterized protein
MYLVFIIPNYTFRTSNDPRTPLTRAVLKGDLNEVHFHISAGADVNEQDKIGDKPLYLAVSMGRKDIVEILISNGAHVDERSEAQGRTPLMSAAFNGYKDIVEYLISKGADVNARATGGDTALFSAVAENHKDIVEILVSKGADVNIENNEGVTALRIANNDIAEILRKHGAQK